MEICRDSKSNIEITFAHGRGFIFQFKLCHESLGHMSQAHVLVPKFNWSSIRMLWHFAKMRFFMVTLRR